MYVILKKNNIVISENKCYSRNINNTFNLLTVRSTNGCYLNGIIINLYFFTLLCIILIAIVTMIPHIKLYLLFIAWEFIKKKYYSLNKNKMQCETFLVNIFKTNFIVTYHYIYIYNFSILWLITTLKFIQL